MDLLLAAVLVVALAGAALAIAGLVASGPAVLPVGLAVVWVVATPVWSAALPRNRRSTAGDGTAGSVPCEGWGQPQHQHNRK